MEDYIAKVLRQGYICPSRSPALASFFFIEKDGSLRPCIVYRGLTAVTVKYPPPLPLNPLAIEQLHGAAYFQSLTCGVHVTLCALGQAMSGKLDLASHLGTTIIWECRMAWQTLHPVSRP